MMEILFRGKRIDNDEWAYGMLCNVFKDRELELAIQISDMFEWIAYPVIPETVGQYIGIDDNDGKEIFVGDIVRCCGGEYYQGIYEFYENVEVKFETYALSCLYGSDSLEVIGKIHDNPELLEVQSEKP